jgi:transcriptional regulator with XRE-family HTH domain
MRADDETLSGALKRRRQELGLSLAKLAGRVRTSAATISRYENGWHRFELYTLQKLASGLGCRLVIGLEPLVPESANESRQAALDRLRRLFWDKPLRSADLRDHPAWVMRRVLEYGGLPDVRALLRLLGRDEFLRRAAGMHFSSEKTGRFWAAMLAQEGVKCKKGSFPRAARISWLR